MATTGWLSNQNTCMRSPFPSLPTIDQQHFLYRERSNSLLFLKKSRGAENRWNSTSFIRLRGFSFGEGQCKVRVGKGGKMGWERTQHLFNGSKKPKKRGTTTLVHFSTEAVLGWGRWCQEARQTLVYLSGRQSSTVASWNFPCLTVVVIASLSLSYLIIAIPFLSSALAALCNTNLHIL